jgi:hypothetical protein
VIPEDKGKSIICNAVLLKIITISTDDKVHNKEEINNISGQTHDRIPQYYLFL